MRNDEEHNLEEIFEAVSRDGYVIAQEYLPAAAEGDTRLFLMNGMPLRHKGKYAAFRRVRTGDDIRSNIHAGGRLRRAELDDTMFQLAEMVRPRLVEDGMFLVGLDIVGDKLMEINVFSPGGLGSAEVRKSQLHARRARSTRTESPIHEVLSSQLQQRGVGDTLVVCERVFLGLANRMSLRINGRIDRATPVVGFDKAPARESEHSEGAVQGNVFTTRLWCADASRPATRAAALRWGPSGRRGRPGRCRT